MDPLAVLKKRGWIVAVVAIVLALGAVGLSFAMEPQYRASTRLLYQKSNLDLVVVGQAIFSSTNADREVQTGGLLVDTVADSVLKDLGLQTSRESLLDRVEAKAFTDTDVIELTAVDSTAAGAAEIADTFAKEIVDYRNDLELAKIDSAVALVREQLGSLSPADAASEYGAQLRAKLSGLESLRARPVSGFRVLSAAAVPADPVSPRTAVNGVRGAILGIIVGIGIAFLVHYIVTRPRRTVVEEQ